jgi:hypothetical protein
MSNRALSAGQKLRQDMDERLGDAAKLMGLAEDQVLQWDEKELMALEAACAAADRSEALGRMIRTELRKKTRHAAVLVKLSAE